ncbi:MAG: PH domain-containing protein [Pirellulaceae bacterium]
MIIPEKAVLRASKWCYRGVWSVVTRWLRVPEEPPHIVGADDVAIRSFRPSEGFLRYLKLFFWIGLTIFDGLLFIGMVALLISFPIVGLIAAPFIIAIMVLPDIVAYIAIHLRYDTTWYVLSDRSMRIRRGIWNIHETTITYDNIQNVSIRQGPVQRYFGFSDVLVETAGGGAAVQTSEGASVAGHHGLLEGIGNAEEVRDLILAKWQSSRSTGLGDESPNEAVAFHQPQSSWAVSQQHVELLEQIRDLSIQLARG